TQRMDSAASTSNPFHNLANQPRALLQTRRKFHSVMAASAKKLNVPTISSGQISQFQPPSSFEFLMITSSQPPSTARISHDKARMKRCAFRSPPPSASVAP